MIRAFVAIELDEGLRSALAVQQFLLPLPVREPAESFHLTLAFLGGVPERRLEDAHERFGAIRAGAFPLALRGLGLFGGDRPRLAYAGVEHSDPLQRLQAKVSNAARRAGIEVEARKFVPHVTLGRFRPPGLEVAMRLERAVVEAAGFRAYPMQVLGFAMFQSFLGARGSRYEKLAEYSLDHDPG